MPDARREPLAARIALVATATMLLAAGVVALTAPASAWTPLPTLGLSLPPGAGAVAAGLVAAITGWRLMRDAEDAAFTLLIGGCVLAGVGAHGVAVATAGPQADAALRVQLLIAYLGLFGASTLVAALWASMPGHAMGRWVAPLAGAAVVITTVGALARAAGLPASSIAVPDLSTVWRSGLLLLAVWLLGAVGSLRAAGVAHLAAGRPPDLATAGMATGARATVLFWAVAALAAVGCLGALLAGGPGSGSGSGAGGGVVLGPLLWLLIGLVSTRWSRPAAWTSLALSLAFAAEAVIAASTVFGWALLSAATVAGWSSLEAAAPGGWTSSARAGAAAVALVCALPALAGADSAALVAAVWAPSPGFPVPEAWTPALVFAPVGLAGLIVLRRRLVPAFAEAEAVAGEPFEPSRYVTTLLAEALTGSARVRTEAVEAERTRLASDLHADVLPGLARAAADTRAGASPDEVEARLRVVESDVRSLLAERRHVILEELGLVEALEWLADRAEDGREVAVTLSVDSASTDARPPRAVERAAFRVAQLAVDNAVRHADPARVGLEVAVGRDRVRVVVADDGRGLDPAAATAGFGLGDMRLQAAEVGARVEIGAGDAGGTRVVFSWPR